MSRAPDMEGPFARAWAAPQSVLEKHGKAGIAAWLVHAPQSHPFWPWHIVSVIHLRDVPGIAPAHKDYPEAQYEFAILAIDPERCPQPEPDAWETGYPLLSPADVITQFHGVDDATAREICRLAVKCCVDGRLSPDCDFRSAWNETIAMTVKHFRDGKHARPS